jgi:hypothetical protein
MIFGNKRKKKVIEFFDYVENELIPMEKESEPIQLIKNQLKDGRNLIANNEWGIAFENLSSELVEHFIIINRKGESIAKDVIRLCGLEEDWILKLRRLNSDGYVPGSWRLVDSEELAKQYKYTYYKPSRKITNQLKVGNLAKLNFQFESTNNEDPSGERMWVIITEVNQNTFKGTLDNNPFYLSELYYQDEIEFEHKHIIDHDLEISEPNLVDKYYDRCFVTNKVLYENAKVNYLYREEPMEKDDDRDYVDTGWRILAGDETDEYMDDPNNTNLVSLGAVLSRDDSFIDLLDSKIGTSFERNPTTNKFEKIDE